MSEDAFDKIVNDVRYSPFQRQLAARLGCDADRVTVENVVALVEAAQDVTNWIYGCCPASDINALGATLAPFKREVG